MSDVAELAADLVHQGLAGEHVRFATFVPLAEQGLDSRRSGAYQARRAAVEVALPSLAYAVPRIRDILIEVAFGPRGKSTVDQAQRMANARQPGHRLGIDRRRFRLVLR